MVHAFQRSGGADDEGKALRSLGERSSVAFFDDSRHDAPLDLSRNFPSVTAGRSVWGNDIAGALL
jgi:hypothetical protein